MEGHFSTHFELEDREKGVGSVFSGVIKDGKVGIKKNRRSVEKRVVSVPISNVEGSRGKGEGSPPSDSWAWRKYGQKPIKGSPYPRGYYRCSSFKGCPARKQVERSSVDPTMLLITYACEHNHSWPVQKTPVTTPGPKLPSDEPAVFVNPLEVEPGDEFADLGGEDSLTTDDLCWFSGVASSSQSMETVLHNPICGGEAVITDEFGSEDSLFADLGELPECSVVFRRSVFEKRCSLRAGAQVVDNVRHPISSYDAEIS